MRADNKCTLIAVQKMFWTILGLSSMATMRSIGDTQTKHMHILTLYAILRKIQTNNRLITLLFDYCQLLLQICINAVPIVAVKESYLGAAWIRGQIVKSL